MKTELNGRTLWFDGSMEVDATNIMKWIEFDNLHVKTMTDEIVQFNKNVLKNQQITVKTDLNSFDTNWNIPEQYLSLDIEQYIKNALLNIGVEDALSDNCFLIRHKRVNDELSIYKQLNLYDLLRTLVYIIDKFRENNVVWGVGRGSSVSSYILYILGVHDIDSVMYELDFNEFLRV
jgi:DNA polymerase III alpha subunit